jgi:hypothetical protein
LDPSTAGWKLKKQITDEGLRMKVPPLPQQFGSLESLLAQCWQLDPETRPSFIVIARVRLDIIIVCLCADRV